MNTKDRIAAVSKASGLIQKDTETVIKAFINVLKDEIVQEGGAEITGLGMFKVGETAARRGRHPQTGATLMIPAGKKVGFKAAKSIRDSLKA
jgi:nucleoid DNA-binding protein